MGLGRVKVRAQPCLQLPPPQLGGSGVGGEAGQKCRLQQLCPLPATWPGTCCKLWPLPVPPRCSRAGDSTSLWTQTILRPALGLPQKACRGQVSLHLAASTASPRLPLATGNLLQYCLGSEGRAVRQHWPGWRDAVCPLKCDQTPPSYHPWGSQHSSVEGRERSSSWVPLCLLLPVHDREADQPCPALIAGGGRRGQFLPCAPVLLPHLQASREPHSTGEHPAPTCLTVSCQPVSASVSSTSTQMGMVRITH